MGGVFEHLTREQARKAVMECRRVLARGGKMELTAPDLMAACRIMTTGKLPFPNHIFDEIKDRFPGKNQIMEYALSMVYGGQDRIGQVHQWGWTQEAMDDLLSETGFKIRRFDTNCFEPNTHLHYIAAKP